MLEKIVQLRQPHIDVDGAVDDVQAQAAARVNTAAAAAHTHAIASAMVRSTASDVACLSQHGQLVMPAWPGCTACGINKVCRSSHSVWYSQRLLEQWHLLAATLPGTGPSVPSSSAGASISFDSRSTCDCSRHLLVLVKLQSALYRQFHARAAQVCCFVSMLSSTALTLTVLLRIAFIDAGNTHNL